MPAAEPGDETHTVMQMSHRSLFCAAFAVIAIIMGLYEQRYKVWITFQVMIFWVVQGLHVKAILSCCKTENEDLAKFRNVLIFVNVNTVSADCSLH